MRTRKRNKPPKASLESRSTNIIKHHQRQQQARKVTGKSQIVYHDKTMSTATTLLGVVVVGILSCLLPATSKQAFLVSASGAPTSGLRFSPETNAYSGLTFTFDPRLDKRVEWLHFEHWLSIMHQSSELLHEALNGRAHLGEVRVLIPYKWRHVQWPVLNKPGAPIIMNRRLRYTDSDVIVGFEDPNSKETPFAVQHDECARQGLHISMPISFLEQDNSKQSADARLKARLLVREFASHRYGLFKESGFRNDFMYPPFASLAGLSQSTNRRLFNRTMLAGAESNSSADWLADYALRGFDQNWQECSFDTQPQNGLPTGQSAACVPYLTRVSSDKSSSADKSSGGGGGGGGSQSFNLMSADPFSHADLSARFSQQQQQQQNHRPVEWRDLADSVKWHFCGDNFPRITPPPSSSSNSQQNDATTTTTTTTIRRGQESYAHNQLANNKQNVLCQERSAMEIIKASDDFKRPTFSPSTFNRLPAPNFSFLQEMPPRVILCVEYAAHLFQSRRLDHGILEAAIGKFFAYDLIADSEIALVLFGQRNSSRQSFERLDSSIKSRLTLYNPAIDPFDEPVRYYTEQELSALFAGSSTAHSSTSPAGADQSGNQQQQQQQQQAKIVKGTCSFAKLMQEVGALQQQRSHQYDDVGADIVIISSGLFIEDEAKIEEIIRAQFRADAHQINLIIYPSTMLFNTKSQNGFVVLDALESDAVVKNRLGKLLLIQRLTNANIHLVKEHLDANGDVKMSTLIQFYQIFDHISKGHSWDQQQSMTMLAHENVPSPSSALASNRLQFQFQVDASLQNELIVAFIDPKPNQLLSLKPGKRFSIRNLQLRSPSGQLVLTDSHPWPMTSSSTSHGYHSAHHHSSASDSSDSGGDPMMHDESSRAQDELPSSAGSNIESALFPFRTQLGLAGFHLKAAHLAMLANSSSKLSGLWTLSAESDEQLQTSALAMARVNPAGDSLTANCWIQSYYEPAASDGAASADELSAPNAASGNNNKDQQQVLRAVKVFAQTRGPTGSGPVQEIQARLEVQDEMGNIVQNVNMLDDGLGAPDITRADGIHSQYVQRAHRPGFYKVSVEMSGSAGGKHHSSARHPKKESADSSSGLGHGQDNTCCGSFVPARQTAEPSTRHLSRQLYCGTFYVEPENRLGQQRPPRVTNLTIVGVDQDQRRVTLRWWEPSSSDSSPPAGGAHHSHIRFARSASASAAATTTSKRSSGHLAADGDNIGAAADDDFTDLSLESATMLRGNHLQSGASAGTVGAQEPGNRYEIKLFSDRDILKRSFDSRRNDQQQQLELGYKFSELNVVGNSFLPNSSNSYGGLKEVTLRLPSGREGIYYIAMRVYNNLGIGSQVSNIVQLWLRSNLTELEELESIYGQPVTLDANGNVYDKNGELIGQRSGLAAGSSGLAAGSSGLGPNGMLLRGGSHSASTLDGITVLLFLSACGFLSLIVCVSLFVCLVSSARRSMATSKGEPDHDRPDSHPDHGGKLAVDKKSGKKRIVGGGGSGSTAILAANGGSGSSSMVSSTSQCEASSGHGDSLATGSVGGGSQQDMDVNKLSLGQAEAEHLSYSQLRHQHQLQQQQADQIKNAYLQQQQQQQANNWHTIVNGYAYATVASPHQQQQQFCHDDMPGDLNQNGLGTVNRHSQQQWPPAEVMLAPSHYDKLKQRDTIGGQQLSRRVELLDSSQLMNGLPQVPDEYEQSYLIRTSISQQQQHQVPNYFNQQLQQQLSSVLKSKQQQRPTCQQPNEDQPDDGNSSPALEGVAQEGHESSQFQQDISGQYQPPPPPAQYIYQCTEANIHHAGVDPSIYSQATGLQQVVRGSSSSADDGYYANHQQYAANIYGAINDPYNQQQHHQQQQQQHLGLPDNCLDESYDKPNSAISEV